jgi:4a-hydroxytetrahydrobiopterin dehydratase
MSENVSPQEFHRADGLEDWRVVGDGGSAHFVTGSFDLGARLVQAIGALPHADHADAVLRPGHVVVSVVTRNEDMLGFTTDDVDLARAISAAARDLGAHADVSQVQQVQVTVDAMVSEQVMPFWRAVLGYEYRPDSPDEDLVDPRGRGPAFWFQRMDAPRPQRNRLHVDVFVPHDLARARVDAALAAGGTLVKSYAPDWWTLADAEGNEVDVSSIGSDGSQR